MKRILSLSAALLALMAFHTPAQAQEFNGGNSANSGDGPAYVSIGGGIFDVDDDDQAADFRLEYRSGTSLFWQIRPWGGAEVTSDGSFWVGGGVLADIGLTPEIYFTPSFGAGIYDNGDSDKDLDYWLEFRSQAEIAYQFENQHRLGLAFSHTSNASLGDKNPGEETLALYWHIPTNSLMNGF